MRFNPLSEDELASQSLLEPGIYPFEVMAASEEISKAGNEMIKIKINVFGPNGKQIHIYDYLIEKLQFKLRHFCEATGLLAKYESGKLSELDCEGKSGMVKIKIDAANGQYLAKNAVHDYVKPVNPEPVKPEPRNIPKDEFDDDVPF